MFELFTDDARRVVVWAQEWARRWGRPDIGTGEFLAALAGDDSAEARRALAEVGVTLPAVHTVALHGRAPARRPGTGHVPFSPRMRDALERAAALAIEQQRGTDEPSRPEDSAFGDRLYAGRRKILRPGHLLLALLDDPDCAAMTMLRRLHADPDDLRDRTRQLMEADPDQQDRESGADVVPPYPVPHHRPAGTSRFPPDEAWALASPDPLPEFPMSVAERWSSAIDSSHTEWPEPTSAGARAAWAELQRRQVRLPVRRMRSRAWDNAVWHNERQAMRRLADRLSLSEDEHRWLRDHHLRAVEEIASKANPDRPWRRPGPYRPPHSLAEARRSGSSAAFVVWLTHRRPRLRRRLGPLIGWLIWLGNRRVNALEVWLRVRPRPR